MIIFAVTKRELPATFLPFEQTAPRSALGRFFSFNGSLYKPLLKFRVCAETPRSGSANHHTLALACTGKTGQNLPFPVH